MDLYPDVDENILNDVVNIEDDPTFTQELFAMYFKQGDEYMNKIKNDINNKDLEQLGFDSHFLKGSSAVLGFKKLENTLKEIKALCESKELSNENKFNMLQDLVAIAEINYEILETKFKLA